MTNFLNANITLIQIILFIERFMSGSKTADQIQNSIDQEEKIMNMHKQNGKYDDAENSRLKIEQFKKDLEARSLYEMDQRHKKEQNDLEKAHYDEMATFNNFWNQRTNQLLAEGQKSETDLAKKHSQQQHDTRKQLELQLPLKVKQTSELLNLRKMEQHMVKQKNFAEAHKVQQQIFKMEKSQRDLWMQKRNDKISTALNTLIAKQTVEMNNLKKRYKTLIDELNVDRTIEDERLHQKYANSLNDLKSQQDKEVINLKGYFRSKGGKDSPMRSKTSFVN